MKLDFELQKVVVTEFGVGRENIDAQTFVTVPVDVEVQTTLREMVAATLDALHNDPDGPAKYDPSEKHGAIEYLYVTIDDELATLVRELHDATNLPIDAKALTKPTDVFCYFTRMTDEKGRQLTAVRRASQFKGILKNRLIQLVSDSLRLIADHVFKLDNDFDFLIDSRHVHILRPSAFEFAGKLQAAVLAAVPKNIATLKTDLPFVDFLGIEAHASKHPRAARYLASICARKDTKDIDKGALKKLCQRTSVKIIESKGGISVSEGHELGFLEVIDRRRYELELVKGKPEQYRAPSRKEING